MARKQDLEKQGVETLAATAGDDDGRRDLQGVLQQELQRLPTKYRCPMVLCYLQGRTNEEAARQLQWPVGTLKVRLMRGREMLRTRLTRRGLVLSAAAVAGALSESVAAAAPVALADTSIKAALLFAAGKTAQTGVLSAQAVALSQGVLKTMYWTSFKIAIALLLAVGLVGGGLATYRMTAADRQAAKIGPEAPTVPAPARLNKEQPPKKSDVEKLQGTWNIATLEMDGMKMPDNAVTGARIVLQGNNFTSISMGATYKGTFKVDATKMPRTIDMTFTDGPEKGNTSLGIYELDGDHWKICLTVTGTERPKEFATKAGGGHAFETLKRQTAEKEQAVLAKEMAFLAGEWTMVSGEIGGQQMPEAMAKTAKRVAKGNETTVTMNGQIFLKATITIDPSKKPKTIDYLMTDGPSKGKTQLGIYEVDGDTVRFCFGSPGQERATEFATKAGDGRTLSVWKRVKGEG